MTRWQTKSHRKPLILRGARQVEKSTLVKKFGKEFTYFIQLNLEKPNDKRYVIKQLRYFYEEIPALNVIAAGSLLEFALGDVGSFPVGRVEELTLHPLDFEEFLMAIGDDNSLKALRQIPVPIYAYDKLFELFKKYVIIGGMPEVIKQYVVFGFSLAGLKEIYASIWETYKSDVVKYARNPTDKLLNVPYFAISQVEKYITWVMQQE